MPFSLAQQGSLGTIIQDVQPEASMLLSPPQSPKESPESQIQGALTLESTESEDLDYTQTPRQPVGMRSQIGDEEAMRRGFQATFVLLQQHPLKQYLKLWIKVIEPNKQRLYPYRDQKRPNWWPGPERSRFREPDHLLKAECIWLATYILDHVTSSRDGSQLDLLKQKSDRLDIDDDGQMKRDKRIRYVEQLFHHARMQQRYKSGKENKEAQVVFSFDQTPLTVEIIERVAQHKAQQKGKKPKKSNAGKTTQELKHEGNAKSAVPMEREKINPIMPKRKWSEKPRETGTKRQRFTERQIPLQTVTFAQQSPISSCYACCSGNGCGLSNPFSQPILQPQYSSFQHQTLVTYQNPPLYQDPILQQTVQQPVQQPVQQLFQQPMGYSQLLDFGYWPYGYSQDFDMQIRSHNESVEQSVNFVHFLNL